MNQRFPFRYAALCAALFCLSRPFLYADDAAADPSVSEKYNYILGQFRDEQFNAALWTGGWTVFNGGSAAFFIYKGCHERNKASQVNDVVIGAGSGLACIGNIATPMVSIYAPLFLQNRPDGTAEEREGNLSRAEDYLRSGSNLEEFGQSWIAHTLNFATSTAGALVVGVAYRDTMRRYHKNPDREAGIMFLECFLSGEIQILTQPMKLVTAQREYQNRYGRGGSQDHNMSFFVIPTGAGMIAGIKVSF
jgi:hypothetical protein